MSNNRKVMCGDDHLYFAKSPHWLMRRTELKSHEKLVYIRLRACGLVSGQYWASQAYLAHECGLSIDTVQRSLKKLESTGLISRKRHGKKMFNSYFFYEHEWMTDSNKYQNSDTAEMRITQSDTAEPRVVIPLECGSIYKDKREKISKNIHIVDLDTNTKIDSSSVESVSLGEERWKDWQKTYPSNATKGRCVPKLNKMSKVEFLKLLEGTTIYLAYVKLRRENGFPSFNYMNASTFLNQKIYLEAESLLESEKKSQKQKSPVSNYSIF